MIVFIDTEVNPQTKKVADYGAVRADGAVLHTHHKADFDAFVGMCDTVCGHNIVHHDLKYTSLPGRPTLVDTLFLSPLLFPKRPYHRLLKDDKLQVDELNNPVNDAMKARDLLGDEVAAWQGLSANRKEIYFQLLHNQPEFGGFFQHVGYSPNVQPSLWNRVLLRKPTWVDLIPTEFAGKLCSHADFAMLARQYPVELAYCLAVIGADDIFSITPAWVVRNYPEVVNVMTLLRNKSCASCDYCRARMDAHSGLKEFFGYDEFRTFDGQPMQQQAVEAAIGGESLLTIFPTGGGKSLTFQLPALMAGRNTHGLTVVISPLQSLMKDQVDNLAARGISEAVTINGLLDPIERAVAIEQVADGTAHLLYIAPEMLRSRTIERLLLNRHVVRFVIDEAHCFSAWGHDFRVDYLYIGDFIRRLQEQKRLSRPIAVSCFTATAKQKVISDICDYFRQKLGLNLKVFAANAERKNLRYSVLHADTDADKYNLLRSLILEHDCPTIVYVARTRRTRELANHLNADGIRALPFNGKMDAADKVKNQNAFMNGEVQVIVATSAFGMGVDKKDVGLVVHYNISDSLENYVQEAGRAGRDPHMQAECFVLFADSDLDKHFQLLSQTKLSISEIQQVWKAIKDLSAKGGQVSCSPLDIARQAGWADEVDGIDTRVKAAIAALENAGFVERGNNSPHVFATSIAVRNMDEARQRIEHSPLFDEQARTEAVRIVRSLISARATAGAPGGEAESRVDYLADVLGMDRRTVIRNINLMRQDGLLADSRDMQAWVGRGSSLRNLDASLKLEQFLLQHIGQEPSQVGYKELNEEAQRAGLHHCTVMRLKTLLHFLRLKDYIHKQEHSGSGSVSLRLQADAESTMARFERRKALCRFVVERLATSRDANKEMTLVNFSIVELLAQYTDTLREQLFAHQPSPTMADMEEALLYLSKTDLVKIEGGFVVIYNTMQINRRADNRARYGKEQYRLLDEFYKQRIRQIHIVGEYANLMVRDYQAALQFVNDYFTMDFRRFIGRYFKEERRMQIDRNITPVRYDQIFGQLSDHQREIIADHQSRCIVVAAGPGSGKTRVLVHKLAALRLLEDVKSEQLLMLTFSRAAATEFKKRLVDLVGSAAHYVEIKTFHSYSFDLLGQPGNLEEVDNVVRRAAEMIERGEVEPAKIVKSVLVIDEAQDMGEDDFRLVQALMQHNEEMRVIAVGDDDQNIYAFRGSNAQHMQSLAQMEGAHLYEMTDNYRSDQAIVQYANHFVQQLQPRMKQTPIHAMSHQAGMVNLSATQRQFAQLGAAPNSGSTAVLTLTNNQALQVAHLLRQRGLHVRFVQSTNDFHFINLAEFRYFSKQLGSNPDGSISPQQWEAAKQRTASRYATSTCLPAMRQFYADFEATHRTYYRSDLREFALESNYDDFVSTATNTVFVSTIHKAKGREFDNVHLFLDSKTPYKQEALRTTYVGITRARHTLCIYHDTSFLQQSGTIALSLTMHDVWLDYFRAHKAQVLALRSGDPLHYADGILSTLNGCPIASLSSSMREQLRQYQAGGYEVAEATISFIIAWRPRNEQQEVAVCLANLLLRKNVF